MTRLILAVATLAALGCNSFFLNGALDNNCDAPRTIEGEAATLRKSNCQPANSVCCRRSSTAVHTTCQYPEDCFVAPYQGACVTAVDCADTQTCTGGSCQCDKGPSCEQPMTHAIICCGAGQVCAAGMCGTPSDGGT